MRVWRIQGGREELQLPILDEELLLGSGAVLLREVRSPAPTLSVPDLQLRVHLSCLLQKVLVLDWEDEDLPVVWFREVEVVLKWDLIKTSLLEDRAPAPPLPRDG